MHESGNGAPSSQVPLNGGAKGVTDGFEQEQARLRVEIADAKRRTEAAQHRIAEHEAQARAALRAELEATRLQLAEIERVHRESVTVVRQSTQLEVDRILAEAHQQATAAREGGGDVGGRAGSDGD